jgi:flagellar biosynthesis regulator FlaF
MYEDLMKERIGKLTDREQALIDTIVDGMDSFIKQHGDLDRSEFMAAYSFLARILFTIQTPMKEVDAQCIEIDAFCEFLKGVARKVIT